MIGGKTKLYKFKGKMTSIKQLAKMSGLSYPVIYNRINRDGWTPEEAIGQRPIWSTRGGRCKGHFKITFREAEQELDSTHFVNLPKIVQRLVMSVPCEGKTPYGKSKSRGRPATQYGRFLRIKCRKVFDSYYKRVFYPRKKKDYDETIIQSKQEVGNLPKALEGPGNPGPGAGGMPVSGHR